jgi:cell shape-determining protein MreD
MILALVFLFALVIEGTLSLIPLVFVILLNLLIIKRDNSIFYIAFLAGIVLDLLSVRPVGLTSAYLVTFFLAVLLYERKFEIKSFFFITLASFFGSLGLLFLTSFSSVIILQAIVATCISLIVFKFYESRLGVL